MYLVFYDIVSLRIRVLPIIFLAIWCERLVNSKLLITSYFFNVLIKDDFGNIFFLSTPALL